MRLRTRSWLSWTLLAVGVLAGVGLAYGAFVLSSYAWDEVVSYSSPYVKDPSAETSASPMWIPAELEPMVDASAPVLAGRVVLVIVDGMRDDVSRSQFSTLNKLRTYGTDVRLTAPQPSLSYPNWTTIITGARQQISGVTTNWFDTRAPAPTLMEMAELAGRRVAVIGPEDFETLLGVRPAPGVSLRPWPRGGYLTSTLVDDALRIAKATEPQLVVVHLPDLDEAGHEHGGASEEYRAVAKRMDIDMARLVDGLQREDTAFVVVADHGHIDTGGHGGWEAVVTTVPAVFAGSGVKLGAGEGVLEQVAPTVSVLMGIPVPSYASGGVLPSAVATTSAAVFRPDNQHRIAFNGHYIDVATEGNSTINSAGLAGRSPAEADEMAREATAERQAIEKSARLPVALIALAVVAVTIGVIGLVSWRALVSAGAGTVAYYVFYNGLFFLAHGYAWSLSAFNTETMVESFMLGRMVEALIAGLLGAAVAAAVYPFLRESPGGPRDPWYLSGWLALGACTILVGQLTLALQVAWYYWAYGIEIVWVLPDFRWAFKADLDMVQITALGAAVILAPLVTYLVGRYHPRVRVGGAAARSKT